MSGEGAALRLLATPPDGPRGIRDRAMLELAYASGLRVSELVTLPLADINLRAGFVRVTGKGKKTRLVPLGAAARDQIQRYLDEVILHGSPDKVGDEILRLRDEIGLDYLLCAPLSHQSFMLLTEKVLPRIA